MKYSGLIGRVRASPLLRALGHRNLRLYLTGQGLSLIGTWMQRVGVGWLTWELTHSGFWLGAVATADIAPSLLLAPIAGAVADRFDRQRLGSVFLTVALLQAAVLAAVTWAGRIDIWLLLMLQAVNGVAIAFWQPARFSIVPDLVPRVDLTTTIALTSTNFSLARFIGPALAGPVILGVGVWATFALNAISYLAFLLATARLVLPAREKVALTRPSVLAEAIGSVAFAARDPAIGTLLGCEMLFALSVRPLADLMPGFAAMAGGGAGTLAAMTAAMGAGALIASFMLAVAAPLRALPHLLGAAMALSALALLAFLAAPGFVAALIFLAIQAMCAVVVGIATQTLLQFHVADALRGRILSLYGLIARGGPALGALILGAASEATGLTQAVAIAGLAALVVAALAWRARRRWLGPLDRELP